MGVRSPEDSLQVVTARPEPEIRVTVTGPVQPCTGAIRFMQARVPPSPIFWALPLRHGRCDSYAQHGEHARRESR